MKLTLVSSLLLLVLLAFFSVFWWMVGQIWNFFSLKPLTPKGQSKGCCNMLKVAFCDLFWKHKSPVLVLDHCVNLGLDIWWYALRHTLTKAISCVSEQIHCIVVLYQQGQRALWPRSEKHIFYLHFSGKENLTKC